MAKLSFEEEHNTLIGYVYKPTEQELFNQKLKDIIEQDDISAFQEFLSCGKIMVNGKLQINDPNFNYTSINYLCYAIQKGSLNCFKFLLLNGVKLESSAFSFAAAGGKLEILKILEEKECPFNYHSIATAIVFHRNKAVRWFADRISFNCDFFDSEFTSFYPLFDHNNIFWESTFKDKILPNDGNQMLYQAMTKEAIKSGNLKILKYLIETQLITIQYLSRPEIMQLIQRFCPILEK